MKINEIKKEKILNDFKAPDGVLKKVISINVYSTKKVNLEYKRLSKPKINYYLELKKNKLSDINKTLYLNLDYPSNTKNLKNQLSKLINTRLYDRFKDSDYKNMNYLSNQEKEEIYFTELFYKGAYFEMLNIIG